MVQIPDSVRPALAIIRKYHFWMLAAVVPLVIVPLLVLANASLRTQIQAARSQIDSRFSALRSVEGQNPHPNEAWSTKIVENTKRTKRDTLQAWASFWDGQAALRQWPASLGADFVQRAAVLKAGGTLPRKLLERYQDSVRQLVRELPRRMGSDDHMRDESTDAPAAEGGGPAAPGAAPASKALVRWSPDDQRRLYQSFNWEKAPSTGQVVLAQEELWVYGLFCDTIARINRPASGAFNAPITNVAELAVGYPAVEDVPGGTGRITVPAAASGGGGGGMEPMQGGQGGGRLVRPVHPRFSAGQGAAPAPAANLGGGEGAAPAASADDVFKNWIYVDFDGKPLMAADLATNPATQMVHLMPFTMRLTMDQRSLDALLVDLASSPIPIDVRQVRVNAGSGAAGQRLDAPLPAVGQPGAAIADRPRLHDIGVEIRGTIALATPPSPQALGIEEGDLQPPAEEQEPPAAQPVEEPAAEGLADDAEAAPEAPAAAPADAPVNAEPVP